MVMGQSKDARFVVGSGVLSQIGNFKDGRDRMIFR